MAITVSIDVHEAVLKAAREKEKSYDEAVKEFLEVSDEVILNCKKEVFDRVVTNMRIKNMEPLKKVHDKFVEAYLNAKEKHKIEPKKLLDWIATNSANLLKTRRTSSTQFEINDLKKDCYITPWQASRLWLAGLC